MAWLLLDQLSIHTSEPNLVLQEVLSSELLLVSVLASEPISMKTMTLQVLSLAYCNQGVLMKNQEVLS